MRTSPSLAALTAALLALAACKRGGGPPGGSGAADGRPPVPVVVSQAVRKDVPEELFAVGTVQAFVTVSVRPLVGGEIVGVFFEEGDEVEADEPLFEIDPRPYRAVLARARGALEQARQRAASAKADARRHARMVKSSLVTQQRYAAAVANARALAGQVAADEAAVRRAELDLQNCRIASPIRGRAGAVLVQIGNVVQASQASPLVVIEQLKPISVAFAVPGSSTAALRAGVGRMEVIASGERQGPSQGWLEVVNNAVDPAAGTIRAKATFPNEDEALSPGESVRVRVVLGTRADAVVAPAAAVVPAHSGPFVFVVRQDGTVEQRSVKVAQADAHEAVVVAGLSPGETVVTDGQLALVPGARVTVKERAPPGAQEGPAPDRRPAPAVQGRRP